MVTNESILNGLDIQTGYNSDPDLNHFHISLSFPIRNTIYLSSLQP